MLLRKNYLQIKDALFYYLKELFHRVSSHNSFLMSGGLTFSIVTCIIPFVLIVFSILGKLLEVPEVENQINALIEKTIPYRELAAFVKSIVHIRIVEFRQLRSLAGFLGAVGLFFAASGLVSSLRTIFNSIFGIDRGKNVLIAKLRDFGIILLIVIVFLLSMVLIPFIEAISNLTGDVLFIKIFHFSFLKRLFLASISFLAILSIFYFIYYIIPYKRLHKKVIFLCSFWAAFLWEIAKLLFGLYLTYSANLSEVYGAYVFVVAIVFWLYYSSLELLLGQKSDKYIWNEIKKSRNWKKQLFLRIIREE